MRARLEFLATACCCAQLAAYAQQYPPPAQVTSLPDIPDLLTAYPPLWAGYLSFPRTNNASVTVHAYHILVRSPANRSSDPLLFWMNGGPGCSSLYGFGYENGPFSIGLDAASGNVTFAPNVYALANIGGGVNVVYIDQPCGVGFSVCDPPDYKCNDTLAANDNYALLRAFFVAYPEFVGRDTWLTGESYAGQYIPDVADLIAAGPARWLAAQLRGLAIGNPSFMCAPNASVPAARRSVQAAVYYGRGLLSLRFYDAYVAAGCDALVPPPESDCAALDAAMAAMVGPLNPNNMYQNVLDNATLGLYVPRAGDVNVLAAWTAYLNRDDARTALRAAPPPAGAWINCSHFVAYTRLMRDNAAQYRRAIARGWRTLVYSGDVDIGVIPTHMTQVCVLAVNATLTAPWRPWTVDGATAGYVEAYEGGNFTFATVKGAGHEVPAYAPLAAFQLMQRFVIGNGTL